MDDALVQVVLDIGGRPYYRGPLPSPMYDHFLRSFADNPGRARRDLGDAARPCAQSAGERRATDPDRRDDAHADHDQNNQVIDRGSWPGSQF